MIAAYIYLAFCLSLDWFEFFSSENWSPSLSWPWITFAVSYRKCTLAAAVVRLKRGDAGGFTALVNRGNREQRTEGVGGGCAGNEPRWYSNRTIGRVSTRSSFAFSTVESGQQANRRFSPMDRCAKDTELGNKSDAVIDLVKVSQTCSRTGNWKRDLRLGRYLGRVGSTSRGSHVR